MGILNQYTCQFCIGSLNSTVIYFSLPDQLVSDILLFKKMKGIMVEHQAMQEMLPIFLLPPT